MTDEQNIETTVKEYAGYYARRLSIHRDTTTCPFLLYGQAKCGMDATTCLALTGVARSYEECNRYALAKLVGEEYLAQLERAPRKTFTWIMTDNDF